MARVGHSRSAPAGRLLRLLPAAMAAYELRYLLTHVLALVSGAAAIHLAGGMAVLVPLVAVLGTGLLLRESARGLGSRLHALTWSPQVLRSWIVCVLGLGALLVSVLALTTVSAGGHAGLMVQAIGMSHWAAAGPALALAALLLALSVPAARWLLARVRSGTARARTGAVTQRVSGTLDCLRAAGAPLRAGWSDRGPPSGPLAYT